MLSTNINLVIFTQQKIVQEKTFSYSGGNYSSLFNRHLYHTINGHTSKHFQVKWLYLPEKEKMCNI